VKPPSQLYGPREFVGKRLVGEGGTSSALRDSEKLIVQPRTLISLGIGRYTVVRHAIPRVPINVAAFKTIQIIFLSPLAAESLLPPALSSRGRILTA
jgi:hypothetical protein